MKIHILSICAVLCFMLAACSPQRTEAPGTSETLLSETEISTEEETLPETGTEEPAGNESSGNESKNGNLSGNGTENTDGTSNAEVPNDAEELKNTETQEPLTDAPDLVLTDILSSTLNEFSLSSGNYSWTYQKGEKNVSFVACGTSPLDSQSEDTLVLPRYNQMDWVDYLVSCPVTPDRFLVREWDRTSASADNPEPLSTESYDQPTLPLKPGRIYEITAVWEEEKLEERGFCGNASYHLLTE